MSDLRLVGNLTKDRVDEFPDLIIGLPGRTAEHTQNELTEMGLVGMYNPLLKPITVGANVWWVKWPKIFLFGIPVLFEGIVQSISDQWVMVLLPDGELVGVSEGSICLEGEAVDAYVYAMVRVRQAHARREWARDWLRNKSHSIVSVEATPLERPRQGESSEPTT